MIYRSLRYFENHQNVLESLANPETGNVASGCNSGDCQFDIGNWKINDIFIHLINKKINTI